MTDSPLELTEIEQILLTGLNAEHNRIHIDGVGVNEDGHNVLWTEDNEYINLTKTAQAIHAAMREA